jgi:hypothetical protein
MRKSTIHIRKAEATVAIWCILDKSIRGDYESSDSSDRTIKITFSEVVASFAWKKLKLAVDGDHFVVATLEKRLKALGFEDVHVHRDRTFDGATRFVIVGV